MTQFKTDISDFSNANLSIINSFLRANIDNGNIALSLVGVHQALTSKMMLEPYCRDKIAKEFYRSSYGKVVNTVSNLINAEYEKLDGSYKSSGCITKSVKLEELQALEKFLNIKSSTLSEQNQWGMVISTRYESSFKRKFSSIQIMEEFGDNNHKLAMYHTYGCKILHTNWFDCILKDMHPTIEHNGVAYPRHTFIAIKPHTDNITAITRNLSFKAIFAEAKDIAEDTVEELMIPLDCSRHSIVYINDLLKDFSIDLDSTKVVTELDINTEHTAEADHQDYTRPMQASQKLVFNRPYIYFIYDNINKQPIVVGQYKGHKY